MGKKDENEEKKFREQRHAKSRCEKKRRDYFNETLKTLEATFLPKRSKNDPSRTKQGIIEEIMNHIARLTHEHEKLIAKYEQEIEEEKKFSDHICDFKLRMELGSNPSELEQLELLFPNQVELHLKQN